jgi:ABC-type transport system involved in multi-copper enzyme maturation permease subunit
MNLTLLKFIVYRHRLSVGLAAAVPVFAGTVVGVVYPNYAAHRQLVETLIDSFGTLKDFFSQGNLDILSASGAFTMPFQHPVCLVAISIVVAIPAISMPAGDRGRGSLDLLSAAPISRGSLIATIAGTALITAPLAALASLSGARIGAGISGVVSEVDWSGYLLVAANEVALGLFLASAALLVSVISADLGAAILRYGVFVFLCLMCDVAARLDQSHPWLSNCTPFGYHRPGSILADGLGTGFGILLGGTAIITALAFVLESRRPSV